MTTLQRIKSPVVGARYHKGAQEALAHMPDDCTVWLVRQPSNPHDRNAVAIFTSQTCRQQLGFVLADVARTLAPIMDARGLSEIEARFLTNAGKPEVSLIFERT